MLHLFNSIKPCYLACLKHPIDLIRSSMVSREKLVGLVGRKKR